MNADSFLCCDAGGQRFAFRSRDVRHVERAEHLRHEAGDDGRAGVLMLGGHAVPVFPLGAVLGVQGHRAATAEGHIAVTGTRNSLSGWLVDRIARADHSGQVHVAPLPLLIGSPANMWFEGAVRIADQQTALLVRPEHLPPGTTAPPPPRRGGVIAADAFVPHAGAAPVAVVFITDALPPSAATRYALSGRQIAGIVQGDPPIRVPGCADHIAGVTWWRGAAVPVIDFRAASSNVPEPRRRQLIARCGARHLGALVAFAVEPEVLMCGADGHYREMCDAPRPWFASGVFDINGEAVALLDLDALLDAGASGPRHGDAVLPDLLVERAARDAEAGRGALDAATFGA